MLPHSSPGYPRQEPPPRSRYYIPGRYGHLFDLEPFAPDTHPVRKALCELGAPHGIMDGTPEPLNRINEYLPAGFTYLGQFIAHDLTYDPTSSLQQQRDPEAIQNYRTPALDLDSLYGGGPFASRHLYQRNDWTQFLIGKLPPYDKTAEDDLPRNVEGVALLADPRNDDNLILAQLTLAFLKFHNRLVHDTTIIPDWITDPWQRFLAAQQLVRWHYQWMVLHQFLPRIVGCRTWRHTLGVGQETTNRRIFRDHCSPYIPVEFSVAAFRFGHSLVQDSYNVNHGPYDQKLECEKKASPFVDVRIFSDIEIPQPDVTAVKDLCALDLRGGLRVAGRYIEWDLFFDLNRPVEQSPRVQFTRALDIQLAGGLFVLPIQALDEEDSPRSVAQRDLLRHLTFSLPSGQHVAEAMRDVLEESLGKDVALLTDDELGKELSPWPLLHHSTPLWYYLLKEAECHPEAGIDENAMVDGCDGDGTIYSHYGSHADRRTNTALGPVGGRIVAEVIIGLLEDDSSSFLGRSPNWRPRIGEQERFGIEDLLVYARMPQSRD